jgi:hypothetical protein
MRLIRLLANFLKYFPNNQSLIFLLDRFPRISSFASSTKPATLILVECVEDIYFLGIFSSCISELSKRTPIHCEFFVHRSINAAWGVNFKSLVLRSYLFSGLIAQQWVRVYRKLMSGSVGYRSVSWVNPWMDFRAFANAWSIWRKPVELEQLRSLKAGGITVGDLIIDTYIRFRPAATVHFKDPFLLYIIWQSLRDVWRAEKYFSIKKPKVYLSSYSTYVQHGVAARMALKHGTSVMCFGNLQQLGKLLTLTDHFHTNNPNFYRADFMLIKEPRSLVEEARKQLEIRLTGGVDDATVYMATSAYSNQIFQDELSIKGSVIVFLHDFFDSLHVYSNPVFPDFWTWACFTIETLSDTGRPFAVKPHPNQRDLSAVIVEQLRKKYPLVKFISSSVSNASLVAGGICAGVSIHGTVIHELAYLGVPTIGCSQHPHVAFDFCKTARNRSEYLELLQRAHMMKFNNIETIKHQVLMFYVMHNLSGDKIERLARIMLVEYWKSSCDDIFDYKDVDIKLTDLSKSEGFSRLIDRLEHLIVFGSDIIED